MYTLLSLVMAVVPALYLVRHFYREDRKRPEPVGLIVKVFIAGVIVTVPVGIIESVLSGYNAGLRQHHMLYSFIRAFVIAGLCEELAKYAVVKMTVYADPHFDEVADGVVYAVVAGLGFACFENIIYVMGTGMGTAVSRAFTAVPMHAACSGIMGYGLGRARFMTDADKAARTAGKGLFAAVAIHGTYDFVLFISPVAGAGFSLLILPIVWYAYRRVENSLAEAIREDVRTGRVR